MPPRAVSYTFSEKQWFVIRLTALSSPGVTFSSKAASLLVLFHRYCLFSLSLLAALGQDKLLDPWHSSFPCFERILPEYPAWNWR